MPGWSDYGKGRFAGHADFGGQAGGSGSEHRHIEAFRVIARLGIVCRVVAAKNVGLGSWLGADEIEGFFLLQTRNYRLDAAGCGSAVAGIARIVKCRVKNDLHGSLSIFLYGCIIARMAECHKKIGAPGQFFAG